MVEATTLQAVLQVGRPTVVDRCPTAVDKGFVAQKALSTKGTEHCIYTFENTSTRMIEWKRFGLLLASDAIMHARCCVHRSRER